MRVQINRFSESKSYRSREELAAFAASEANEFAALSQTDPNAYNQWGQHFHTNWSRLEQSAKSVDLSVDEMKATASRLNCFEFDSKVIQQFKRYSKEDLNLRIRGALSYLDPSLDSQGYSNQGVIAGSSDIAAIIAIKDGIGRTTTGKMLKEILDDHEKRFNSTLELDNKFIQEKNDCFEILEKRITDLFDTNLIKFHKFTNRTESD